MLRAKRSSILLGVLAAILLAGSLWFWLNRQVVQDWLVVRQYTPSSEIEQITERLDMAPRGKFLFYASEPEINNAETFNQHCDRREVVAAVLGCYRDQRIYIFNIENEELDGIQEVTAAHEMLHAAWGRLSDQRREQLTPLLEAAYQKYKTPDLEERMAYYERQQPNQRANELHSILATEAAALGTELEQYYETYFADRQAVVMLYESYHSVFVALETRAETLRAELEQTAASLNRDIASHNAAIEALNQDIEALNQSVDSVDRTNPYEVNAYNARRQALGQRQVQLQEVREQLDQRRAAYSKKIQEYNEIVVHTSTLVESIDSLRAPTDLSS